MKAARYLAAVFCLLCVRLAMPQEAGSGVDLRATVTAQAIGSSELTEPPRSGAPLVAGAHLIVYPTIKFSEHWFMTGAVQLVTRPYYYTDLSAAGYGAEGSLLQATLNYSRVSQKGAILLRAGEMSTAFGSFVLRYDDTDNPLVDVPKQYGYYSLVSILGVAGVQLDATRGKFDGRIQFANSSPANPRSLFVGDQYGNWAGGAGYTIRQGFRVGVSGYRGPYLDRSSKFFRPGEVNPSKLPAHALGLDANWAHGHTTAYVEAQRFVMPYTVVPTFYESAGYAEVRQVLSPRWFIAGRYGLTSNHHAKRTQSLETAAGFRPNRFQLLKIGYEFDHYASGSAQEDNIVGIQFITSLHKSAAWQ
ncbi:MAG TPA: hypothetical protein VHD85_07795 [Terracidiphilus sp.]|nr:hypothetical protein [Terracidiphilus sp.]